MDGHAHVGTELVYATDREDLEPPFKVPYGDLRWVKHRKPPVN